MKIEVFNILGQQIYILLYEEKLAGDYQVTWDGKDASGTTVASGIYFYRMQTEDYSESRKMLLLK